MEDQVPSSNIPQETGSYYQSPEGPRFQNPAEFAATQQQVAQQAPPMPDFQEMRRLALEQAIQQVTQQPAPQAPVPQAPPAVQPSAQPYVEPDVKTVYVRRNLTLAEILVVFALASGVVLGVQGLWSFTTDLLPRIEIREK